MDCREAGASVSLRTRRLPRYEWEPPELVATPVWLFSRDRWSDPRFALGSEHDDLRADLTTDVIRLRNAVEFRFNV